MRRAMGSAAIAAAVLIFGAAQASAQTTFNFEDGTDQGFGTPFGNNAGATFPIVTDGPPGNGTKYMRVPIGGFQVAGNSGETNPTLLVSLNAAAAAPTLYKISYDYLVNPANLTGTVVSGQQSGNSFLQIGTFINAGNGYYAQNGAQAQVGSTQLVATAPVVTGHVDALVSTYLGNTGSGPNTTPPTGQTFYRLGLILNSDLGGTVDFDNISVTAVPEPTSIAVLGAAGTALAVRRRRA